MSRVYFGEYAISTIVVRVGEKPPYKDEIHLWIQHESGEGTSVSPDTFDKFIKEVM
jgi:hypothetical protein